MFFSEEDFQLETDFAVEYVENDANQTVILYRVDLEKTNVDSIYKEASKENIRFKMPIELPCIYEIDDAEMKSYENKLMKGTYVKPGRLTVQILIKTLEELNCDIVRGDYIGVQVTPEQRLYFTVNNDGRVQSYSNENSMYGTKPFYRVITANYVDQNEFQG